MSTEPGCKDCSKKEELLNAIEQHKEIENKIQSNNG